MRFDGVTAGQGGAELDQHKKAWDRPKSSALSLALVSMLGSVAPVLEFTFRFGL